MILLESISIIYQCFRDYDLQRLKKERRDLDISHLFCRLRPASSAKERTRETESQVSISFRA